MTDIIGEFYNLIIGALFAGMPVNHYLPHGWLLYYIIEHCFTVFFVVFVFVVLFRLIRMFIP